MRGGGEVRACEICEAEEGDEETCAHVREVKPGQVSKVKSSGTTPGFADGEIHPHHIRRALDELGCPAGVARMVPGCCVADWRAWCLVVDGGAVVAQRRRGYECICHASCPGRQTAL